MFILHTKCASVVVNISGRTVADSPRCSVKRISSFPLKTVQFILGSTIKKKKGEKKAEGCHTKY